MPTKQEAELTHRFTETYRRGDGSVATLIERT
jgi:hypothetical protein